MTAEEAVVEIEPGDPYLVYLDSRLESARSDPAPYATGNFDLVRVLARRGR